MTSELTVAEVRELRKAEILAEKGKALFDRQIADGLVDKSLLSLDNERAYRRRRRYLLTEKGRVALNGG